MPTIAFLTRLAAAVNEVFDPSVKISSKVYMQGLVDAYFTMTGVADCSINMATARSKWGPRPGIGSHNREERIAWDDAMVTTWCDLSGINKEDLK